MQVISPDKNAAPGDFVTHVFAVTNNRAINDTFTLALTLAPGLTSLAPLPPLAVAAGATEDVFVTVFVSSQVIAGVNTVELTATSQANPAIQGSATAKIIVAASGGIAVTPPDDTQASAGVTLPLVFTVVNRGNTIDDFRFTATSERGFATGVEPPHLQFLPGERQSVTVTLTIPPDAPPDGDRVTLTATSAHFSGLTASATVSVKILPPPPQAVGGTLALELPLRLDATLAGLSLTKISSFPLSLSTNDQLQRGLSFSLDAGFADLLAMNPSFDLLLRLKAQPVELSFSKAAGRLEQRVSLGAFSAALIEIPSSAASAWELRFTPATADAALDALVGLSQSQAGSDSAWSVVVTWQQDPLLLGFSFLRTGPNFPDVSADEQAFTLSSRADFSSTILQFAFSHLHTNITADPTRPTNSHETLNAITQISLGNILPSVMLQATFGRETDLGTNMVLVTDQTTRMLELQLSQSFDPFTAAAFASSKETQDSVSASLFNLLSVGGQLGVDVKNFSASLQFVQNTVEDASGVLINQNHRAVVQVSYTTGFGSLSGQLTQSDAGLELTTGLKTSLGAGSLAVATTLNMPTTGPATLQLTITLGTEFGLVIPGIMTKGRIEGFVFIDENQNGQRDAGEPGVSGLIIDLDGVKLLTDGASTGLFRSPPVFPGDYTLSIENLPVTLAPEILLPLNVKVEVGKTTQVAVPLVKVASITGGVFEDDNNNGLRDPGEGSLANVKVQLSDSDGLSLHMITNINGAYNFVNLKPGLYRVSVETDTLPKGFKLTTPASVDVMLKPGNQVVVDFGATRVPLPIKFAPAADFTFSPSSPHAGQPVTFDGSPSFVLNGVIAKYEWGFDDGTHDTGKIVQHVFAKSGQYQVTLTVTADNGLSSTKSKVVAVSAP